MTPLVGETVSNLTMELGMEMMVEGALLGEVMIGETTAAGDIIKMENAKNGIVSLNTDAIFVGHISTISITVPKGKLQEDQVLDLGILEVIQVEEGVVPIIVLPIVIQIEGMIPDIQVVTTNRINIRRAIKNKC